MNITSKLIPFRTYEALKTFLGEKAIRSIDYATKAVEISPNVFGIRYHSTIIYTIDDKGNRTFCAYDSLSTKNRLNALIEEAFFHTHKGILLYNSIPIQQDQIYHLDQGVPVPRIYSDVGEPT